MTQHFDLTTPEGWEKLRLAQKRDREAAARFAALVEAEGLRKAEAQAERERQAQELAEQQALKAQLEAQLASKKQQRPNGYSKGRHRTGAAFEELRSDMLKGVAAGQSIQSLRTIYDVTEAELKLLRKTEHWRDDLLFARERAKGVNRA